MIFAVSVFGHKTNHRIGAAEAVWPGVHQGDNGPIVTGHLIDKDGQLILDKDGNPIQVIMLMPDGEEDEEQLPDK